MTIYTRAQSLMQRQLAPFPQGKGLALTLRVTTEAAYVPGGDESTPTPTDYTGSGIRTSYKQGDIDGALVQASDVRFLIAPYQSNMALMPAIAMGNAIIFDGTEYQVMAVKPYNFEGTQIGFVVQGRA